MGMIISMKMISCNNWAPCNQLNIPIPITDPPVDLQVLLSKLYFAYSPGRLAWFYYRLGEFVIYGFLNEALSLGGNYFNESD
jgi:hypothetical protein